MAAKQKPNAPGAQLSVLSIAWILWKWKSWVIAGAVMLAGLSAIVIWRMPAVYKADALIEVDAQKIPEKFVASTVQATLTENLGAISHQALSNANLQSVIDDFKLYTSERRSAAPEDVLATFRKDLPLTLERGLGGGRPGAFRISYEALDPQLVAAVVNRVAQLFVTENHRSRTERADGTSEFLEEQLATAKKSLDEQESVLRQFKLQWTGELPQQEAALLGALNRLQTELAGNQDATNRAQQNKVLLENTLRLAESSAVSTARTATAQLAPQSGGEAGFAIRPLLARRRSDLLREELAGLRRRYLDEHPEVKRVERELADVSAAEAHDDAIARANEKSSGVAVVVPPAPAQVFASPEVVAEMKRERERIADSRTQLGLVNSEIEQRAADRDRILRDIAEHQRRVDRLPIREQQLASITRDYDTTKMNYRSLLDKKMAAEVAGDMEKREKSERFTVADPARVPSSSSKPRRLLLLLFAFAGALLLLGTAAFAYELQRDVIAGEWELAPEISLIGRVALMESSRTN